MVTSGKAVKAGPGSACAGHGHHGGDAPGAPSLHRPIQGDVFGADYISLERVRNGA